MRAYAERSVNAFTKLLVICRQNLIYSASCWLPEREREREREKVDYQTITVVETQFY